MNSDIVTTPFGRRTVSFGLLASQLASKNIDPNQSIDKWKLFRAICEARPRLKVSDRALAVLNALLSFYPKAELCEMHGLVVFPSNQQLSLRAHGMAEQTLRRHLSALVEAGLILRKDSPNGKRYARKDRSGSISDAYGFSLAPLVSRSDEIMHIAAEVCEERLQLQRLREKISLYRRDIIKFNEIASLEALDGDWTLYLDRYRLITSTLDRKTKAPHLLLILEELDKLRSEMANRLEKHVEKRNLGANAYQNERLIQNSESESILETTPVDKTVDKAASYEIAANQSAEKEYDKQTRTTNVEPVFDESKPIQALQTAECDLQTVLKACPDITLYGPGGSIRSWDELKRATEIVAKMLSISPSAYLEAQNTMGTRNLSAIIACILQKAEHITSAGGYLRSLSRKANHSEFSLKAMLMALMRAGIADQAGKPTETNPRAFSPHFVSG